MEREWTPILLRVLSGEDTPERLISIVRPDERFYFIDFLIRYANRFRGEEKERISNLARPFVSSLVPRLFHREPAQRARAVHIICSLELCEQADNVRAALDDPSPLVAMIAARALCHSGNREFAAAVLQRLDRFEQWQPSFLAAMLASAGPAAAPDLRNLLGDKSRPPRVRAIAADALAEVNDLAAADLAADLIATESDRELLAAALRLLHKTSRIEHLDRIRALLNSGDSVVRAHAIRVLGAHGSAEDVPGIRAAFDDPSVWVSIRAAESLKNLGAEKILRSIADSGHTRADLARQILAAV